MSTDNTKGKKDTPKQYRPKTATAPQTKTEPIEEEKQATKPQRGEYKPRGGQNGGQPREQREIKEQREPKEHKDGNYRGGKGNYAHHNKEDGGHKNNKNQAQDENSWVYKYHNLERPKYERTTVTVDTEVPELPAKDKILKAPSKEQFEEEMAKNDKKIADLRKQKQDCHAKRREIIDGGKVVGSTMTYREALTTKVNELKSHNEEKRKIQKSLNQVKDELDALEGEKRNLMKFLSNDCNTEDQVKTRIRQMEYQLQISSSKSANEETKMIKEINTLKTCIPKAIRFSEIKSKIAELTQQKNTFYSEFKEVKNILNKKDQELEDLRKQMETIKEGQTDVKAQGDKVTSQIDEIGVLITAVFAKKDEVRDAYYKAKYDYEVQRDLINHIQQTQYLKDKLIERHGEIQAQQARRAEQIKNLPHPYAKEIETCNHLVGYCHQLMRKAGLEQDSEEFAKETQQKLLQEMNREQVNRRLQDKKMQEFQSKQEREAEAMLIVGGGKKQKGKKQKKVEYEDIFSLDVVIIQKFGLISISPPTNAQDLDKKLNEITEKKKWYEANGESAMKDQIKELLLQQQLQEAAEQDQLRREKAALEEEQKEERPYRGRGGRGGRGRGGHGGDRHEEERPRRVATGRGSRPVDSENAYRQKSEFEAEDDDYAYSAPVRTQQQKKGQKQTKTDMEINEDNFPTL